MPSILKLAMYAVWVNSHDGPIVSVEAVETAAAWKPVALNGGEFEVFEWQGSGPDWLHVHHADDEAWHVLEGELVFKFLEEEVVVGAGTTVFVPAGVAHGYSSREGARYLIALTPRLSALIAELHKSARDQTAEVLARFESALIQ